MTENTFTHCNRCISAGGGDCATCIPEGKLIKPLTIKDLNCSTCPNAPEKEINKKYDNFETYKYFCKLKQLWIFGTAYNTMEITGCCLHPLALRVMTQPVVEELERLEGNEHGMTTDPRNTYAYCTEHMGKRDAYKRAIKLLKGDAP
jgi:hypothetical protein